MIKILGLPDVMNKKQMYPIHEGKCAPFVSLTVSIRINISNTMSPFNRGFRHKFSLTS